MSRPVVLSLSPLESREVLSATLFADIRPGVWGSNPTMIGVSGDTLYFSANDIYHGTELWATDGTATGTHMVKDLNPGKPGSAMYGVAAGNGVLYLIQNGEGSSAMADYKTDGTEAGTVAVGNGLKAVLSSTSAVVLGGMKGELYYLTGTSTPGTYAITKTDGTTVTTLGTFNGQPLTNDPNAPARPFLPDGAKVDQAAGRITLNVITATGQKQVWQTDGTPAGTVMLQSNLTATSPTTGAVELSPGVLLGNGQYLFRTMPNGQNTSSLWAGDGTGTTRTLLRTFDGELQNITYGVPAENTVTLNGKVLFMVVPQQSSGPATADTGIWMSDGTAAGTTKLNFPTFVNRYPVLRGTFDGKAVVQVPTADLTKWDYVLTDGTTNTPVLTPAGMANSKWELRGTIPGDASNPNGALFFQEFLGGAAYRTDGTAAGTGVIDMTGLPQLTSDATRTFNWNDYDESVNLTGVSDRGLYFKGTVFYSGRNPDTQIYSQQWNYGTELWKWDLTLGAPTSPPTSPAPTVTGTVVNDGAAQRSMVRSLTVTFDAAVNVSASGVTITDAGGKSVAFSQQTSTVNGVTTLTLTFPAGVGGSVADGRFTLKIAAGAVKTQSGGVPMSADYTFGFLRLFGDLSGDGVYDREARTLVSQSMGKHTGEPGFNSALDWNSNGVIDSPDETAVVRNWGKSLPPVSPPTSPAPTVTGTRVNDGSVQRSMVKTLTITFDSAVTINPAGVTIYNVAGDTTAFTQQVSTANGKTTLTVTFPSQTGGSIADGRWTLMISASAVKTQSGGVAMASDYTFGFTRLYGDVTGDGAYDRDVRTLVKALLGQHEGDAGYRSDLDVNSDGVIDATDELAAVRNWGKAV